MPSGPVRTSLLSCLLVVGFLLDASGRQAAGQATTKISGRVVSLNRAPISNVQLRVVGLGNPTMYQSGEFSIEIPAAEQEIVFDTQSPGWEIVYPLAGRIAVPRGNQTIVLVVGKPVEQTITEALAERSRLLQQILRENGQQGQALTRVEDGIQRILEKLNLKEADLRDEVRRGDLRSERYPAIAKAINSWVLEATDLLEALRLLEPLIAKQAGPANKMLMTAVAEYNVAWEAIQTGRDGFQSDVESYWPDGALLRRDLTSLFDNEIERTHREQILPVNGALVTIQGAIRTGGDRGKLAPGLAELARLRGPGVAALQTASRRAAQVLESLRPGATR